MNKQFIFKTISKNKGLFFGMVAVIAAAILAGLIPPLVLERAVDDMLGSSFNILPLAAAYIGFTLLGDGLETVKNGIISVFGQKVTHGIRSEMADKLNNLPTQFYVENNSGDVTSRFVNDVNTVESLFTSGVVAMAADACKVLSIIAVIFTRSKGLSLMLVIIIPIIFLYTRNVQKKTLTAQTDNRKAVGRAGRKIPETIKNIRSIHLFDGEKYMLKRYTNAIDDSFVAMEKTNFYDAVYSPVIIMTSTLTTAIMMCLAVSGGNLDAFFGISAGTAVAVISYVTKIFEPIESIGMEIQNIQAAAAGIKRVEDLLSHSEIKKPSNDKAFDDNAPALDIVNVDFSYEEGKQVLNDLNLCVNKGESVTIGGRTGIGKSTLFKLIMGLYPTNEGSVKIFDIDADDIRPKDKRKIFGYVTQQFSKIEGSIKEQITLKQDGITDDMVISALKTVGLYETVLDLPNGIDTRCTEDTLSHGQFRLLLVARAIVLNPKILLLDEMTANLDSVTEEQITRAIKRASQDKTVISISHRLYADSATRRIEFN